MYEEALRTFKSVDELRANQGETLSFEVIGFKAMALHQVGRVDEAKSILEELRTLLKDEKFAKYARPKALLAEVEALIEGTKP